MNTLRPLTRAEVRSIDVRAVEELALPTLVLMENAGRNAAAWLRERLASDASVLVVCGPGNNGGDGGVVARHLDSWGFRVRVAWFADPAKLQGDAATQRTILERSKIDQVFINDSVFDSLDWNADWIVDALLGTGLARPVEGLLGRAIDTINATGKPVLSLDLPSGLDADTGQPLGTAVKATATITFVAPKIGFNAPGADGYTGEVVVAEIGVPRCLLVDFLVGDQ